MSPSLPVSIIGFLLAAAIIGVCGVLLTARAEYLARATGLGQVIIGAVLIGAITSLAGLVTSAAAALEGHASLAVSNALGGIAVQTTFLAVADICYRRINLEHAAASEANLQQSALLIVLLAIPLLALATPELQIGWLHPGSLGLVAAYLFGMHLVSRAHFQPMWRPRVTRETAPEESEKRTGPTATAKDWLVFAGLGAIVAVSGWVVAICAIAASEHLDLQQSLVGGVFTSVATSLPELVVAVTAVRRGAPNLAVGNILGGNTFDVLFLAVSDALYLDGSIYNALGTDELLWLIVTILMAAVLQMGLLRREKHGPGNIGFESFAVLLLYLGMVITLVMR